MKRFAGFGFLAPALADRQLREVRCYISLKFTKTNGFAEFTILLLKVDLKELFLMISSLCFLYFCVYCPTSTCQFVHSKLTEL
ncbi:hypothetical protein DP117_21150 [Brasilonema sp. UFV-L1]|nr:hypothetical protein [Brasilonema sp. UFV-L1]